MFQLLKKPEYRRFNLQPRYWDPAKEAREEREKRVRAELKLEENQHVPDIREQLRQEYAKRKSFRGSTFSSSTLRFFMILIMLFIAAFYVFVKNPDGIMRFFGL